MVGKVWNISPWGGPVRIKGVAHCYYSPRWQRWILRSWPKGQGPDSEYRQISRDTFTKVVRAIKNLPPEDVEAAMDLSAHTPYLDRDLKMKAAVGTLLEFTDSEGKRWMGTRNAIQNIQPMLDSISPQPGSMLFRGPNFWASIDAPTGKAVMFWDDVNAIAWWANYDEALELLLESLGAGEGAVLYRGATRWDFLPPGASGQVLTTQGAVGIPLWANNSGGSGGLLYGAGAPTSLQAAGKLYSRTDAAELWVSTPTTAGGTIVQHKASVNGAAVPTTLTMNAAVTPGNLILAYCGFSNGTSGPPTYNTSKWSLIGESKGGLPSPRIGGFMLARIAQVGDGATLPAFCTAGSDWNAQAAWEIGNTATNSLADIVQSHFDGGYGNAQAVGPLTSSFAGSLMLAAAAMYDGSVSNTLSGTGWSTDENPANNGNYGAISLFHKSISTVGTVVSETATGNAGGSHYMATALAEVKCTTTTLAHWTKVSV